MKSQTSTSRQSIRPLVNETVGTSVSDLDTLPLGQPRRHLLVGHKDEIDLAEDTHRQLGIGFLGQLRPDGKVESVVDDVHPLVGGENLQLDLRVEQQEFRKDRAERTLEQAGRNAEPDRSLRFAIGVIHRFRRPFRFTEHVLTVNI
ncbi:hypothetical protein [Rhizobium sp. AN80A]|uniref:hypothetical protein n=1 Tax=Rhizobium sp. AN80A TaxID=3040673 RepID=UPI0024B33782|nr:hypothetical protein [Rhizobium sp. AN80A]